MAGTPSAAPTPERSSASFPASGDGVSGVSAEHGRGRAGCGLAGLRQCPRPPRRPARGPRSVHSSAQGEAKAEDREEDRRGRCRQGRLLASQAQGDGFVAQHGLRCQRCPRAPHGACPGCAGVGPAHLRGRELINPTIKLCSVLPTSYLLGISVSRFLFYLPGILLI